MALLPWDSEFNLASLMESEQDSEFRKDIQKDIFERNNKKKEGRIYFNENLLERGGEIRNGLTEQHFLKYLY